MPRQITLGTAKAMPGAIQYGRWDAFVFPTGHTEFLPVIIAQGHDDGPCLWLTAGIHGQEHAGPALLYRLITDDLVQQLAGTIVAIPALSPAGLRTMAYIPYTSSENPNRLWPEGKPAQPQDPDATPPCAVEQAFARLFDELRSSADALIDYHNAQTGSLSFVFRDRVLYRDDLDEDSARVEAASLSTRLDAMISAYGHTVVNEFPVEKYIDDKLHRSTSGAALLLGRIPAITVELGTGHLPDPAIIAASMAGTRNVLRWLGMLPGDVEPITGIRVVDPGFPVRRRQTPRADRPCVVLHTVEPGDLVARGDVVAEVRDVWGRPIGDGVLRAEHDGVVIARSHGIYFGEGDAILSMAIPDDAPPTGPYPQGFFAQSA